MKTVNEQIAAIFADKRDRGLVDVKFLHKNLDEGSYPQVMHDFLDLQQRIKDGKVAEFSFGVSTLKKSSEVLSKRELVTAAG